MNESIKIVMLGGSIKSAVGRAHVAALRLTGNYEIVAGFFSRNEEINFESGKEYGIPESQLFESFDLLTAFALENNATVLICTPTDQHAEQVLRCLELGLNVICEKALSDSVESIRTMCAEIQNSKSKLHVIYNYTSFPAVRALKEMVSSGKLGILLKVNAFMPQEGFIKKNANKTPIPPQAWRLRDSVVPTISLDLGVHLHSLVKFVTGKSAETLVGLESSNGNFPGVVDDVRCTSLYQDGLEVNYWYSKIALGNRNGLKIEIYGSEGSAIWEQMSPENIIFTDVTGDRLLIDRGSPSNFSGNDAKYNYFKPGHPTGFIEALSNYYKDIHEDYFRNPDLTSSGTVYGAMEALEGMIFLEAVHISSEKRVWVQLPSV